MATLNSPLELTQALAKTPPRHLNIMGYALQKMMVLFVAIALAGAFTLSGLFYPPVAHAAIRQLEEAPGQVVYQSRQALTDQRGDRWQMIAFKRIRSDHTTAIYLRLVGFPSSAKLDRSQPLKLTNSLGKTLIAADVSQDMFTDETQVKPEIGQYDLQPILMQLESAIPLQLVLPTLDSTEIILNVSPEIVEEWRSLVGTIPS